MNERRKITCMKDLDRRSIIRMGMITTASMLLPGKARALQSLMPHETDSAKITFREKAISGLIEEQERQLCIYNLHTKEHSDTIYWRNGTYIDSALKEMDFIFRDHYNGSVKKIDRRLLDFLYAIQQKAGTNEPYHLISGYRSKRTNARLRKSNKDVAKRSLHISGKAADIRLPEVGIKKLRRAAYELQAGGVGYYPGSNFVHIDVGRVRFWRG